MNFSNSTLTEYTRLSPHHSGLRTHGIDRITPHCVVGQCTAESLGEWFSKSSTKASSNYGIDRNGRVGLYVEEKNRSWCSSSAANDQRAVTIECASDGKEPYAFRDVVYEKLATLCVDICRRNGKRKLLWIGDRERTLSYEPNPEEMVLTVHRWFAKKSCPGEWMYSRMGELAEKVTRELNGLTKDGSMATEVSADRESDRESRASAEVDTGKPVERMIWEYLMARIGNAFGVAGFMGNLYAESGLRSNNLQNSYEKKWGITDAEYTKRVDDGAYAEFLMDRAGYGLAQWTYWSRKKALWEFAKVRGVSIGDLSMQLDFIWKELTERYPGVVATMKCASTVREVSDAVLTRYEKPADQSERVRKLRAEYGERFYNMYQGNADETALKGIQNLVSQADASEATPFLVKVMVQHLNIRTGPGTNFGRVRFIPPGVYTIVEVKEGVGSKYGWARLKSGEGWISLEFCQRE
ncbi:phage tail tip lysozyme [[Clostridium] aminophilum]|uniref:N-acetylmuramoyl-L-alanine amidase n=1 Tax=[Clostridium] aminophilum TaxID=1526 RepID=A0A1I6KLZ8_9FIRM|nr:phage tail tip lysozyme [[Clostridium] aminophilum]SFR92219.1 N-acetylmuramoyl-L-alanine amidase [[Clostridium] aminophilum]